MTSCKLTQLCFDSDNNGTFVYDFHITIVTKQFSSAVSILLHQALRRLCAGFAILLCAAAPGTAQPNFDLVGFATMNASGQNGTTGGAGGAHVQVSTLSDFVLYAQTNLPFRIEIMNDINLAPLTNASAGFPAGYPTGEIFVNSNKTIYSRNSSTIRRGTLRIGKGPNGKHNIIIRNLKFRDLWVLDPSGQYDQYGWDYVSIEAASHHIWVDHCDFEQVYDGMVDIKGASDFVTVSWNVFRTQKKGNLVGHSDNFTDDRGHLNVTFHHNWYDRVEERMPRMRFGNAHVFNLYCNDLGGRGIQSTTEAATLVENVYFYHPRSGSRPTVEENGGPTGIVKVVNSTIVNLPAVDVQFRQYGQSNFMFNPPFASAAPPYPYRLDATPDVPGSVTNYSGVGKIDFQLWQTEHFSPEQLSNAALSGPDADPDADRSTNYAEWSAGTDPNDAGSVLRLIGVERQENGMVVSWTSAGPRTNIVQAASGVRDSTFTDISAPIVFPDNGPALTNFLDIAPGTTNKFYRVRVGP